MIKKLSFIVIFIYALIFVGAAIKNKDTIKGYLISQNLFPKPELFTELYFQDHLGLPGKVKPNQRYSFAFTIHNLEHQDMDYPYEIYILQDSEKQYLDKNSVSIKDREFMTIQQGFALSEPVTRAKVVVELTDKKSLALEEPIPGNKVGINNTDNNQQIDFWIEKE